MDDRSLNADTGMASTRESDAQQDERTGTAPEHRPLVSMVVAAYEQPRDLITTLHCFLVQTLQDFEVLVVHDGPGPAALREAVLALGDRRITYHETPVRNNDWGNSSKEYGSNLARGRYIGHSNDDNYYAPVYFEALVAAIERDGADFAYCNMVHSQHGYAAFDTAPYHGRIDGGGWLCRAEVVKATPWPEPKSNGYADGLYVEALVRHCHRVTKVPAFLFVHN